MKRLFCSALLCAMLIFSVFGITAAAAETCVSLPEAYGMSCPDSESGRHTYVKDVTDATCTTAGKTVTMCSVCGEVFSETAIEATGHTAEVIPAESATCTESGLTEGSQCSVCGEILTAQNVIPATGHTEVILPAQEATCTATGLTEGRECSVCGETLVSQQIVDMVPHTTVVHEGKDATCTENGYTDSEECMICGEVIVASEVIYAGHTEQTVAGKEATCKEDGLTEGKVCSVCGETTIAQETIPALGHTTNRGTCERCGKYIGSSGSGSTAGLDNVPKTGDTTPYGMFLMMALFAMTAAIWCVRKVKFVK